MSNKDDLFKIVDDLELIKFIKWLVQDSGYTFCVESEDGMRLEEIYYSPSKLYFEFRKFGDDNLSLEENIEKLFELATILKD